MIAAMLQQHDLGQAATEQILRATAIAAGEVVVDAGAGLGALSAGALRAGAKVHAVEVDAQRIERLQQRFATEIGTGRLRLHQADVLRWRADLPPGWRVLANPPFQHTSALLQRWLLAETPPPMAIDLVLQREVAIKLTPGHGRKDGHSRASALVCVAGEARVALALERSATSPPSRVDLALWSFRRDPQISNDELVLVDRLLAIAFAGPHTVADALRRVATPVQIRRQAAEHKWNPEGPVRYVSAAAWLPFAKLLRMCHKL